MSDIRSADFATSSERLEQCPRSGYPEFAFIGRSNVGKSSLINMICNVKNLAHTSTRPGKTQLINHFVVNGNMYFVDLPGYGFAKAPKDKRRDFEGIISDYITKRKTLACLFVLIDSRLPLQAIDLDFINWLGEKKIPFALVFTKADKLSLNELKLQLKRFEDTLLRWWEFMPLHFITSSLKKTGKEDLTKYILEVKKDYDKNRG
jgi:GTP-binding protein